MGGSRGDEEPLVGKAESDDTPLIDRAELHVSKPPSNHRKFVALSLLVFAFICLATTGYLTYYFVSGKDEAAAEPCSVDTVKKSKCRVALVESIPEGLTYPPGSPTHPSTYETWMQMLKSANSTVDIASMYWTLRGQDSGFEHPSDRQGQSVFNEIVATIDRGVRVRIVQTYASGTFDDNETRVLRSHGADVRQINMEQLVGGGVLHTKLWIVDSKHFLTGSANTDWRSLTQVKELCQVSWDCPCTTADVHKIFQVYWEMAYSSTVPKSFAVSLHTVYNQNRPMQHSINGIDTSSYLGSSPPEFCPKGRVDSLTSILNTIALAQTSISIAVMDYFPTTLYTDPRIYWPNIDDALRHAAFDRGVRVRVMGSLWQHTRSDMRQYLQSLAALNGISTWSHNVSIEVRMFEVNATEEQAKIPFARVNHNKYMVTDNAAHIDTSNWSGDYFTDTCGINYVINQTAAILSGVPVANTTQGQLQAVFDRDWNSPYAKHVAADLPL